MTAPSEGAASQPRSKSWIVKVALALSLVLNVFFIGGLAYSKFARPQGPLVALGRDLDLAPNQRGAFRDFVQTVRSKGGALRETNLKLGEQIWDELSKPQPDSPRLAVLFAQIADNRREYQTAVSAALLPFLATLNQDQRRRFVEISKRRQDGISNRMRQMLAPVP